MYCVKEDVLMDVLYGDKKKSDVLMCRLLMCKLKKRIYRALIKKFKQADFKRIKYFNKSRDLLTSNI